MHLIYLDDSFEKPITTIAAIAVPADRWWDIHRQLRDWRREIKRTDGVLITRELHATEFIGGRGRLGPDIVTKYRRAQIFRSAFMLMQAMPIQIFTSCRSENPSWAFDRLLTRLHVTLGNWNSRGIIISDAGKNDETTKLIRRLQVYNPIGDKNNPITNIIEDPVFKDSKHSGFIQLADFVSYALLRREKPLASKNRYGIHEAFDLLSPVLCKRAFPRDSMGIIR